MKKIYALILAIVMIISLFGCANDNDHVGETDNTVTTEATLGDHKHDHGNETIGATEGTENTTKATEDTKTPSETETIPDSPDDIGNGGVEDKPSKDTPKPTQPAPTKPAENKHEHSYTSKVTSPTCESKGYTTYTCSCGDSYKEELDYAHNFSGYFCTKCQKINPEKSYDYLKEVIKTNGNSLGAADEYILDLITLECSYTNEIILRKSGYEGGTKFEYKINLTKGTYSIQYGSKQESDKFNAATLTKTTKVCKDAELDNLFHTMLAMAVNDFSNANIKVSLADLGFKVY